MLNGKAIRSMAVITGLTVGLASGAQAAQDWDSSLGSGGDHGTAHGSIYKGDRNGGDVIEVSTHMRDTQDNDRPIFTKANWYFNGSYCYPTGGGGIGCSEGWSGSGSTDSEGTSATKTWYMWHALQGTKHAARAGVQLCQSEPWYDPDWCSYENFGGFDY
ncbi:hypothetical protein [Kytococcus sedentarius]|uniref:hypothetical protein n=1 Tax=Kytococcus sedentarius TaxID=1276 RepID=UPI0019505C7A|nr:hypothetical protein [Kytococcus sedentarius]QRO86560.1 hypothetical protein I6J30_06615 [Kytococcus sedentarius]